MVKAACEAQPPRQPALDLLPDLRAVPPRIPSTARHMKGEPRPPAGAPLSNAETVGFEPTEGLHPHILSRDAH